jgi:transposase
MVSTLEVDAMRCRKCGSESNVRNGRRGTAQCFRCRDCGFQFTKEEANGAGRDKRANAILLYVLGISMNAIARIHNVCPSTVMRWVRKFAIKVYEKPQPGGSVAVELDEMWHFVGSKKTSAGSGRHIAAIPASSSTGSAGTGAARR